VTIPFMTDLKNQLGEIDIYFFDQLLRGRIAPGMRILDAGCGFGRNLIYLLRQGYEVFAVDRDTQSVDHVRQLAATLAPNLPAANFRAEAVESMSFPDAFADVVISSAVLHFARDDKQFQDMLQGTWRVLKPGGLLFCRLASSIGMEQQIRRVARRLGALSGRRSAADSSRQRSGRTNDRPAEDHRGSESAMHDHLGGTERWMTCQSVR
jgi:tellurite methyltransferase